MLHALHPHITSFSTERGIVDANNPYSTFNANAYCGDKPEHVEKCRKELCQRLRINVNQLFIPHQVHGTNVLEIKSAMNATDAWQLDGIDALISQERGLCLCVSTADCVPLFFYDECNDAIGVAHAGWRGTVLQIGTLTLEHMRQAFGTKAANMRCIIGPSIGPEAFEVGDEVFEAFAEASFPMDRIAFRRPSSSKDGTDRWHIDLLQANAWLLTTAGVPPSNIHNCGLCTYTHHHRFFSARRLGINSGRILNGIMKI